MRRPRPSLLALLFITACNGPEGSDSTPDDSELLPASDQLNLIIVLVDTLRADHMSLYGYERETTPFLDSWIPDRVLFDVAISQSFWTAPSVASVMTGLLTPGHSCCQSGGDESNDYTELPQNFTTLAEHLTASGYQTRAIYNSGIYGYYPGFDQGFEGFKDAHEAFGSESDQALEWLDTRSDDRPFFLFLHYMDPHTEYSSTGPWSSMFTEGIDSDVAGTEEQITAWSNGTEQPSDADIERVIGLYDGEIVSFDTKFSFLWTGLTERNLSAETVVVLLSDHGEQFNEHGGWLHLDLWQENIRVPVVISAASLSPRHVETPIQTIDLVPGIAALLDVEPLAQWQGRDLGAYLLDDEPLEEISILSGSGKKFALTRPDGKKFSSILGTGQEWLFDLNNDPNEEINLLAAEPELAAEMLAEMEALIDEAHTYGEAILDE